jgi:phenylacetic acid degradation operon negative regulatory protein
MSPFAGKNVVEATIQQRVSEQNISCTSMVVTVFGDVVSQHGGWIWLGSLIEALEDFGFNERLVRTAVYRLVQNDWLQVSKVGRRSYYCFTENAKGHYAKAARRIYAGPAAEWDGAWTLVIPANVSDDKREEFRKSLNWQGFNTLSPGLYAHPSSDRTSLDETLQELGIADQVVVLSAQTNDPQSQASIRQLARQRWKLNDLAESYQELVDFYRKAAETFSKNTPPAKDCFHLRTLLIHDYRRILLRDPDFPEEMLPQGWIGLQAHDLVRRLYRAVATASLEYIENELENAHGALPGTNERFYKRFGGL